MDYKKAYEEALERAKAGKLMDEVFPELAESEDEKIRKWIVNLLRELHYNKTARPFALKAIKWLEKQKEQKPSEEQPELPGYDKVLLDVKSKVDELYEEASIGLCEYDSGLYNGIAETCMKLRGFIKARLGSDEQPEVDFEKEEFVGVAESPLKTFPRVNDFECGGSYRH